jgi:RHS repeat-associated protein
VALTDDAGAIVASYAYDPFGNPTSVSGTNAWLAARQPLRYRGYYFDSESGSYYLPARYYDPSVARFLSMDPASPSAGNPLSLNRYAYCEGDPVNHADATGAITTDEAEAWSSNLAEYWGDRDAARVMTFKMRYRMNAHRTQARGLAARIAKWAETLNVRKLHRNLGVATPKLTVGIVSNRIEFEDNSSPDLDLWPRPFRMPGPRRPDARHFYIGPGVGAGAYFMQGEGFQEGFKPSLSAFFGVVPGAGISWSPGSPASVETGFAIGAGAGPSVVF